MIKTLSIYTGEIDDAESAIQDLLDQIPEGSLKKNTLGIISSYAGFVETGVLKAVSQAMPFDVIGCTTNDNCISGVNENMILIISILTSDDVVFSAFATELSSDPKESESRLSLAYNNALSKLGGQKPAMGFVFSSVINNIIGDIVEILNNATNELPLFGTFPVSKNCSPFGEVVFNEIVSLSHCVVALVAGNVNPEFYINVTPKEKVYTQSAYITENDGFLVKSINGIPFRDYMLSVGFELDPQNPDCIMGYLSLAFIAEQKSAQVALGCFSYTHDGYGTFGVHLSKGAQFSIATIDTNAIATTATETINRIDKSGERAIIVFSCLTRHLVQSYPDQEKLAIKDLLKNNQYLLSYSGGEICPVKQSDGKLVNKYHNFTFTVCVI
ncbi:MAG: hypothetical protein LBU04_04320 [Christensenellaceae bacterium]|jgi:hypothetical protein|nr:hypothetical protein [Christensenellaceae bacterium]